MVNITLLLVVNVRYEIKYLFFKKDIHRSIHYIKYAKHKHCSNIEIEENERIPISDQGWKFLKREGSPGSEITPGPHSLERARFRQPEDSTARDVGMIVLRAVRSKSEARRREFEGRRVVESKLRLGRIETEI